MNRLPKGTDVLLMKQAFPGQTTLGDDITIAAIRKI
jgi:hypothetical protein